MAYAKQTWSDNAAGGTPISAARLNYMERGIEEAHTAAGEGGGSIPPAASSAQQPALGILRAGLTQRATAPCRLVFTGSSTTAGNNATSAANRYVNRLVTVIQAAYPASSGTETAVIDSATASFGTLSTAGAVHAYNAGEGGTTSTNYLTSGEITTIAAMKPRAVFHMVGSNDWGEGVTPADYKSNMQAKVAAFKAAQTEPCVHILIQTFQRPDVPTPVYPWSEYGRVLREIADADSANVAFIDISSFYSPTGILGSDPLGLIDTDNLHQTNAGHAFMADLLRWQLGIPGAASGASAAVATRTTARLTSDGFGGNSGEVVGRVADLALAGAARTWAGGTGLATAGGGTIASVGTNFGFVGLPESYADVESALTVNALPASGNIYMDIHRPDAATSTGYRLEIGFDGVTNLLKRISGTETYFASGIAVAVGDRIALRYYKGAVEFRRNGIVVASVADATIPAAGFSGLGVAGVAGFRFSAFTMDAIS